MSLPAFLSDLTAEPSCNPFLFSPNSGITKQLLTTTNCTTVASTCSPNKVCTNVTGPGESSICECQGQTAAMGNPIGTFFAIDLTGGGSSSGLPPQVLLRVPDAVRAPFFSGFFDLIGYALFNGEAQPTPNATAFPQSITACSTGSGGLSGLNVDHISGWIRDNTLNFLSNVTTTGPSGGPTSIPNRLELNLNIADLDVVVPVPCTGTCVIGGNAGSTLEIDGNLSISADLTIGLASSDPGSNCNDEVLLTPTPGGSGVNVQVTNPSASGSINLTLICQLLGEVSNSLTPQAFANTAASGLQAALAGGFQINTPGYCISEFDVHDQPTEPGIPTSFTSGEAVPSYIQIAGSVPGQTPSAANQEGFSSSYELSSGQSYTEVTCPAPYGTVTRHISDVTTYNSVELNDVYLRDTADDTSTQFALQATPSTLLATSVSGACASVTGCAAPLDWYFPYNAPFSPPTGFDDSAGSSPGLHLWMDFGSPGDPEAASPAESCSLPSINWYHIPIAVIGEPAPSGPVFQNYPIWQTAGGAVAFVTPQGLVTSDPAAFAGYDPPPDPGDAGASDSGATIPGSFLTPKATTNFSGAAVVQVFHPEPRCERDSCGRHGGPHHARSRNWSADWRGGHGAGDEGGDDQSNCCCDEDGNHGDGHGDRLRRHCDRPDGGTAVFYVTNQENGDVLIFSPRDGPWDELTLFGYLCGQSGGGTTLYPVGACTTQSQGVGPGLAIDGLRFDARTETPGADILPQSSGAFMSADVGYQVVGNVSAGDSLGIGLSPRERLIVVGATANSVTDIPAQELPAFEVSHPWHSIADIACFIDGNGHYAPDPGLFDSSFIPMPGDEVVGSFVVPQPYDLTALDNVLPGQGIPYDSSAGFPHVQRECDYLSTANGRTPWSPNVGLLTPTQPAMVAAYAIDPDLEFLVQVNPTAGGIGPSSSCYQSNGLNVYAVGVQGGRFPGPSGILPPDGQQLESGGLLLYDEAQAQGIQSFYGEFANSPNANLLGGWAAGGEIFGFRDYLVPLASLLTASVPYSFPVSLEALQPNPNGIAVSVLPMQPLGNCPSVPMP